ncbi:glycosyltransferase (plasmid) [Salipiger sp. CCB-MM3]|uniref:glycosyltransferase n=1 Tax=Salipiger sp. CCB-MM3 TaxID=1792508 RepID=UPI00080A9934|nr:glycosyltransferase [Salipiger sp. CCB-MM3]ANT63732.1 glycosyltransferase [Salipiger sp. CCB-MM3]
MARIAAHLTYLAVLVWLSLLVLSADISSVSKGLVVVGLIGIWRYSWAAVNFTRAAIYLNYAFPRLRARAERNYAALPAPAHAYFLVTSFKIEADVTARVYRSIFRAAAASRGGATIVVSIVDLADETLIRKIWDLMPQDVDLSRVQLHLDRIPGTGKRDALARSYRLISRMSPTRHDIVVVADGDTCVPVDIVETSAPFFTDPRVGALTTDEIAETPEPGLFRDWYNLRFSQRQMMMSSQGLSGRVLTLTGRMSVFRADLLTDPGFIAQVQSDSIEHWRLGTVKFLTGDDKSTWFWLLSNGYLMRYLPDVASVSMESQPKPGFMDSAITLMVRWFGNMLRTNGRALALSTSTIGYYTKWALLDQRLGIWTTIAGPLSVIWGTLFVDVMVLPAYIAWVLFTRYVFCWILSLVREPGFPITYPFLLWFSQVFGATVKSYILFRLDRQKWTRQPGGAAAKAARLPLGQRIRVHSSTFVHSLALGWLALATLYLSGVIR